ncbi:lytic transglycosylase, partial [Thermanaerothrix sp.]|uniref:lytic transglycosylase n=1 Tax=Thermanaerothrix sp. TaxID=2972675 RepID=UPI002ADE23E6
MSLRLRFFSLMLALVSLLYPWGISNRAWAQNEDLPVYIVQPNDTINSIARRFGVSPQDLIQTNQLENPDIISVGTPLKIPGFEGVRGTLTTVSVPLGASLSSLSRQYHIPEDQIVRLNRLTSPAQLFVGATLILPVQGNPSQSQTISLVTLSTGQTPLELATASGVSIWDFLLANDIESSAQLLPLDPLIAVGNEQPVQNVAAFPGAPTFVKGIDLYPLPVVQGKTVVVKVSANEPVRASGMLGEWPLQFDAQDANTYVALQGIHAMAQPGLLDFSLILTTAEGTTFAFSQPVLLQPGNYPQDPPLF